MDIDGTLIDRYGDISPENREALARVRNSGIHVSLSTSSSLQIKYRRIHKLNSQFTVSRIFLEENDIFFTT